VVVQPAGVPDKETLQLLSSDYVADLRAEVAKWWETLPTGGVILGDGPIRIITQGQELTPDLDEKTLLEMGFKDMQVRRSLTLLAIKVVDSRPARSAGRVKKIASKPLKFLMCVTKGLYYHFKS